MNDKYQNNQNENKKKKKLKNGENMMHQTSNLIIEQHREATHGNMINYLNPTEIVDPNAHAPMQNFVNTPANPPERHASEEGTILLIEDALLTLSESRKLLISSLLNVKINKTNTIITQIIPVLAKKNNNYVQAIHHLIESIKAPKIYDFYKDPFIPRVFSKIAFEYVKYYLIPFSSEIQFSVQQKLKKLPIQVIGFFIGYPYKAQPTGNVYLGTNKKQVTPIDFGESYSYYHLSKDEDVKKPFIIQAKTIEPLFCWFCIMPVYSAEAIDVVVSIKPKQPPKTDISKIVAYSGKCQRKCVFKFEPFFIYTQQTGEAICPNCHAALKFDDLTIGDEDSAGTKKKTNKNTKKTFDYLVSRFKPKSKDDDDLPYQEEERTERRRVSRTENQQVMPNIMNYPKVLPEVTPPQHLIPQLNQIQQVAHQPPPSPQLRSPQPQPQPQIYQSTQIKLMQQQIQQQQQKLQQQKQQQQLQQQKQQQQLQQQKQQQQILQQIQQHQQQQHQQQQHQQHQEQQNLQKPQQQSLQQIQQNLQQVLTPKPTQQPLQPPTQPKPPPQQQQPPPPPLPQKTKPSAEQILAEVICSRYKFQNLEPNWNQEVFGEHEPLKSSYIEPEYESFEDYMDFVSKFD